MTAPHEEDKLRERMAARRLRAELAVSEQTLERVAQRLELAARAEQHGGRRRTDRLKRARHHFLMLLPAATSVALALFVNVDSPAFDAMRIAEHHVSLPSEGPATLSLSLALHEHDADSAKVELVVPHGVEVTPLSDRLSGTLAPQCAQGRCRYEFEHPTQSDSPHVAVHVSEPGSYRMEVRHASDATRMREVVVIHARR